MTPLTLEEIEKLGEYPYISLFRDAGKATSQRLLATARAYWELVNNMQKFEHSKAALYAMYCKDKEEEEDKPHAPTIRAIVEALEAGREFEVSAGGDDRIVFNSYEAIKSLEKYLE